MKTHFFCSAVAVTFPPLRYCFWQQQFTFSSSVLVWAEDPLLHGVNAVISSGAQTVQCWAGWVVPFGQDLAGNCFKSLIYCWILKTCRVRMKVCPGSSHSSFRNRWGLLATTVIWINVITTVMVPTATLASPFLLSAVLGWREHGRMGKERERFPMLLEFHHVGSAVW